MDTGRF